MQTLILHPENEEQLNAFKVLANALKVSFEVSSPKEDETTYLTKSGANKMRLEESIEEYKKGNFKAIKVDDLWK